LAKSANLHYTPLNGTEIGIKEIREVIAPARTIPGAAGVLLYLDELQYLNKKQQQILLSTVETGEVTLIAATTENPFHYIYPALLSRCQVYEFKALTANEIASSPLWAAYGVAEDLALRIATSVGGDMRRAIGTLESLTLLHAPPYTLADLDVLGAAQGVTFNKSGDDHFDLMSAFQKSLRGSDADAAVYWLARLLDAGELLAACRRLLVCAAEDVGLAYPEILPIVYAAVRSAEWVGMPEARIPLADAVILVARSPKCNTGAAAVDAALADIHAGAIHPVPPHIRNIPGANYKYPHDYPGHWVRQDYLPKELLQKKYVRVWT
jgi:putative ATPase